MLFIYFQGKIKVFTLHQPDLVVFNFCFDLVPPFYFKNEIAIFQLVNENLTISSCHFRKHKSVFLQILHRLTLLYFFSSSILCFNHKEPMKVKISQNMVENCTHDEKKQRLLLPQHLQPFAKLPKLSWPPSSWWTSKMNDLSLSVYVKKSIIVFVANKLILIYFTWFLYIFVNYKYNVLLERHDVCLMPLSTFVTLTFQWRVRNQDSA